MKKRIIKILCGIVCFTIVVLMMVNVNALSFQNIETNTNLVTNYASDTSGAASSINRMAKPVVTILKWTGLISGIIFFINGIRILINKKQKRGIIYIIIAVFLIWSFIMLDALVIHNHNIDV